ncbi:hypothetical protein RSSM_04318 [Rhodopirellula sallentina SM41]|uniref:Uncharacterized protein n=1 Tax=Rhodopirellula sallentina SM41 TaxID=1263870 RepID=M5TYG3_9BACT|nr:hypothetical protein RSSM_04318 [Rhodopirellula sallentina SM41]
MAVASPLADARAEVAFVPAEPGLRPLRAACGDGGPGSGADEFNDVTQQK